MRVVADVTYNGSRGRNLMNGDGPGGQNYNRFSGDLVDGRLDRLNPSFAGVNLNESRVRSRYNGVSLQLQRRYADGFAIQGVYTFGVSKDLPGFTMWVEQPELDWGYTGDDVRHRLAANFILELPYHPANRALDAVLGGWQLNGLAILQSGAPFTVTCSQAFPRCDFNADGVNNDRVNLPASGTDLGSPSQEDWLNGVLNAADFTYPAVGTAADQPRNAFRGPGFKNMDFSLVKNIDLPGMSGQESTLQVRLEMFNAFNWVNLNNPSGSVTSANFGRVTGQRGGTGGPRVVQLGARWSF